MRAADAVFYVPTLLLLLLLLCAMQKPRRKAARNRFNNAQNHVMREWITVNQAYPYPEPEQKQALALRTGLTVKQVRATQMLSLAM